ncbi:MAG: helix-turn-helix domain-containing protein [Oscillospiraceae bacterium]|nr:helix-turn-helix domain-containing protein [Oscillospiraceae bacterium]
MELDYAEIGKRIARRRKQLGLKQTDVEERADIGYKYLTSIERAISIPSIEVIMRLAAALDTTPDEFLLGTVRHEGNLWRSVAEELRGLTPGQLELTAQFIAWVRERDL